MDANHPSAASFATILTATARRYWTGEITYEEQSLINHRTWDEVESRGFKRQVQAILRKALP